LLAVVAAAAIVLCGGGVTAGLILYDRATRPDRSTPSVVVRQYINTYLDDRDDAKAEQFACSGFVGTGELAALRTDMQARESKFGVHISVAPGVIAEESRSSTQAAVSAEIVFTTTTAGQPQRSVERWEFQTVKRSGWRVCDAHQLG
jgi:hypothetical protein